MKYEEREPSVPVIVVEEKGRIEGNREVFLAENFGLCSGRDRWGASMEI